MIIPSNGESSHANKLVNLNKMNSFGSRYGETCNSMHEPIMFTALAEVAGISYQKPEVPPV